MAQFIEVSQMAPGTGKMTINVEYIVKVERSSHATGGTDIIVKDGRVSYDSETGYKSYTVSYRVKESYETIKKQLPGIAQGMK